MAIAALIAAGLFLFVITLVVNTAARIVIIVLPTAMSRLITSSLLAIARITGETAPLILLGLGRA